MPVDQHPSRPQALSEESLSRSTVNCSTKLALQQRPAALFITCADSRIDPCLLTQTKPGELFICRVIGNIVPRYPESIGGVSATIEYAVGSWACRTSSCAGIRIAG